MLTAESTQWLRASLRGHLLTASDPGYEEARKIHNAMIDRHPAMIVRCAGASDVIAAVKFARQNRLPVAVRGSGHNVVGTSLCDDGIVIDLSLTKGIRVEPASRTARVEPGVTWAELARELQAFGLGATGGYVGTTGVGGLTLGGGLGWMVRKHGLALDNLLSADVVTADGVLLTASAQQNEDLFWAIRGGGGNFGIVTSFEFRVHEVGTVFAGMVLHSPDTASEALRFWRRFEATAPEEMSNSVVIFTAPPGMPVPDALRNGPIVGIGGVYAGPPDAGERALAPLRAYGPPSADIYQAMPYSAAQTMADFLWPKGSLNYWKSGYLTAAPSDNAFATILGWYATVPSPRTVMVIEHNGDGAMSRVGEHETAFGNRTYPYNFLVTSVWTDPAESDTNIRWTREFWEAMRPFIADAAYVNYLGDQGEEMVRLAYGSKYAQLARVKAKYDPTNFFCMNQNIKPTRTTSAAIT